MPKSNAIPSDVKLTERQRQVWEMTNGLGEFDGNPMRAQEIAEKLGITPNSVYVTRRRVKQALENQGHSTERSPLRYRKQKSHLEQAVESLETELAGYDKEKADLEARIEQIERERPAVQAAIERLKAVTAAEKDLVAA